MERPPTAPPDARALRRFGLLTGALFLAAFALLPWLRGRPWPRWPHVPGGFFLGLGVVRPTALGAVHCVWMRLGAALGWVNLRLILLLTFVVLLTPLGLLLRLVSRDPMRRRLDRGGAGSYRDPSTPPSRAQMTRPF